MVKDRFNPNSQEVDEPGDPANKKFHDGYPMRGRGAAGGGSKPTPQAHRPRSMAISGSSAPKSSQRLRGR